MNRIIRVIKKYAPNLSAILRDCGQSMVIYVLILTLISVASAGTIYIIKNNVDNTMDQAEQRIVDTNTGSEYSFIEPIHLSQMTVQADDYSGAYDGSQHTGAVTVQVPQSGYTIRYGESEDSYPLTSAPTYASVGNWTVYFKITAEGYRDYCGSFNVSITTRYVPIPSASGSFTYDGTTKYALIDNFSETYCTKSGTSSASNAGSYTVTFSLNDTSYMKWSDGTTAAKAYSWSIAKCNLSTATIAAVPDQNWTGSAIEPTPAVTCNGSTLRSGTDFTYSYNNNTSAGTATVKATAVGSSNYTGYISTTFNIVARTMTVSAGNYSGTYDGYSHTGTVTVTTPSSGATVYYGTSASNCTSTSPIYRSSAGSQRVYFKVTANNYVDYTGSFTITINKAKVSTTPSTTTQYYTGSRITPTWSNYDSSKLTAGGTLYATSVGSYTATFTPTSNYTWSDGSTTAKSVSWSIVSGTGTSYYTATMYGTDRLGNGMNAVYRVREDWNYSTNSSTVTIQWIRFDYYTNASSGYPRTTGGTGGSIGHDSWGGYSLSYIQVNSGSWTEVVAIPVNSTAYTLPFNGSSSCYLTYYGSTFSSNSYSVAHDANGNAKITLGGYWSWGTTASYPKDTRGGIHGGSSTSLYQVVVNLKDTKP